MNLANEKVDGVQPHQVTVIRQPRLMQRGKIGNKDLPNVRLGVSEPQLVRWGLYRSFKQCSRPRHPSLPISSYFKRALTSHCALVLPRTHHDLCLILCSEAHCIFSHTTPCRSSPLVYPHILIFPSIFLLSHHPTWKKIKAWISNYSGT